MKTRLVNIVTGGAAAFSANLANAEYGLNLQPAQTAIARQMYDLHNLILLICAVIFVIVFGIMFYSIFKHRRAAGHKAQHFHENTTVEIVWTIIPFFILIGMAYPATQTIIAMKDTSSPDMTVKVTGYQWKWGYDYLQDGISFYSNLATPLAQIRNTEKKGEHYLLEVDKPMIVPTGKKVRVLLTANDVIHSWWVPALGVKQDAVPGFVRDAWFNVEKEGTYRGQCAELCGKDHAFMPIVVEAVSPEKYAAWVAEEKKKTAATQVDPNKKFSVDELKSLGEKVYSGNCTACHQANGQGVPPAFPALAGSKIATGDVKAHMNIVLNGKPGTAMAPFKQLSDVDIAAVISYERNSWGNKSDPVQPADIKAARGGAPTAAAPAGEAAPAESAATPAPATPPTAAAPSEAPPAPAAAPSEAPPAPAAAPAPASEAPAASAPQAAATGMPVKIFFPVGKSALPEDAAEAVKTAADHIQASADAKLDVTGYTDKSGDSKKNLDLAKERAKAVREALKAAGVPEDRINMKPPESITGSGDDKEARRVEINPAS